MIINCPLCKSNKFKIIYKSTLRKKDSDLDIIRENLKNSLGDYTKHSQIVKCKNCSLIYVNPRENINNFLSEYKNVVDHEYNETEKFRKVLLNNHLKELEKLKKRGDILDIGCFTGIFLELAKNSGWIAYGIEPSTWATKIAQKKGIKIIGKTIETTKLPKSKYDVITLFDVIEHLSDPNSSLQQLYYALKDDGIIVIGTPNIESFISKILGSTHNPHLIRMHLVLFGKKTIQKILENNEFKIINFSTYGRIIPLYYFFKVLSISFPFTKYVYTTIMKNKILSNFSINLNLHDEFLIIAKKANFS